MSAKKASPTSRSTGESTVAAVRVHSGSGLPAANRGMHGSTHSMETAAKETATASTAPQMNSPLEIGRSPRLPMPCAVAGDAATRHARAVSAPARVRVT